MRRASLQHPDYAGYMLKHIVKNDDVKSLVIPKRLGKIAASHRKISCKRARGDRLVRLESKRVVRFQCLFDKPSVGAADIKQPWSARRGRLRIDDLADPAEQNTKVLIADWRKRLFPIDFVDRVQSIDPWFEGGALEAATGTNEMPLPTAHLHRCAAGIA